MRGDERRREGRGGEGRIRNLEIEHVYVLVSSFCLHFSLFC